jgi:diaminohydroxyphosphoribosylaminopyrimidine deaminase/5-amino-6-(5-phosphoribosylamino)uracil reductase
LADEREAMRRALELAWRGWGRTHPNPLVGAVVLAGDTIVGEGYHAEFGGPHAETVALEAAGARARGATLVVTLEPCNHQGKQPPCTEAVLRAGVRRVVAAIPDPHAAAAGGAERLRAAGVEVELGLLAEPAAAQNAAFLRALREPTRPYLVLKLATSLDFRIADETGQSRWVSGEPAREYVHWLRAGFDAIAVGLGTARADDPSLTVRGPVTPRVPPRRIVFDRALHLPSSLKLVAGAREIPTTVIAEPTAPEERAAALEEYGVRVIRAAGVRDALRALRADGVAALLVEGGGRLAGALLAAGLVDRFAWIQAPLWLGSRGVLAVRDLPSGPIERAHRWRVAERRPLGEDTLLVVDRVSCSPES